jgi:flagellar basal-body rod protein FlgC
MPLSSSLQISASGLTAQRLHLDVISNNIANANTTRATNGEPYRRQQVLFGARESGGSFGAMLAAARGNNANPSGTGVQVTAIQPDMKRDFKVVHDPGHPDADAKGNVRMPNVEPIVEMVDMISATRAYEAGITAINTAKQMQQRALDIGR